MAQTNSYDLIPYASNPFPQTHPERLRLLGRLFGMEPPAIDTARVLELGCAGGGNLIPMAEQFPRARFLGIDGSARHVAEGWRTIGAVELGNIELRHLDILDFPADAGQFDYILCHGVYSWVPRPVQERVLDICRRHLAADGVAYVSYNTFPGWHIRGIVREMMRFHGLKFAEHQQRLAQAKALVEFVAQNRTSERDPFGLLLKSELELLTRVSDSYVHHEHLEDLNQPCYFHEFAERAAVHGLQYLGEAEVSTMLASNFLPQVAETLQRLGADDILQMEQYMDFVRCRYFRQTLLCHASRGLNRALGPERARGTYCASPLVPQGEPDLQPGVRQTFTLNGQPVVHAEACLVKAALLELQQVFPLSLGFDELLERACGRCASAGEPGRDPEARLLGDALLRLFLQGMVQWRSLPSRFTLAPGERPLTSALIRRQAEAGHAVTNLQHETVRLDELHRQTLRLLDGRSGPAELVERLLEAISAGKLTVRRGEAVVTEEAALRAVLHEALPATLDALARRCLLLATGPTWQQHPTAVAASG